MVRKQDQHKGKVKKVKTKNDMFQKLLKKLKMYLFVFQSFLMFQKCFSFKTRMIRQKAYM